MRFGRRRPAPGRKSLRLGGYRVPSVIQPPALADFSPMALNPLHDIMGNDQLGDCVVAAGYHCVAVATGNADGNAYHATLDQVIADYSAISGYTPGDSSTDNGCDEHQAMDFWRSAGFAGGTRLAGWLAVDPTNPQEVKEAIWLFERLHLCLELPSSYTNPFPSNDGFVWDDDAPNPDQGHAIMAYGYTDAGLLIDSWGMLGTLTWGALAHLCSAVAGGACNALLSDDLLSKATGKSPLGLDWTALAEDFAALESPAGPQVGP